MAQVPASLRAVQNDPADAAAVLKRALDNGFNPVKLAGLREDVSREHQQRFANLAGLKGNQFEAERQRQGVLGSMLDDEIAADPFTGVEAQKDTERLDDTIQDANTYQRPDVSFAREDTERLRRMLAGEPQRQAGLANRDVAAITASGKGGGEGWAEPTVSIPDPYGSGATYPVPRRIAADPQAAKDFIDQYRAVGVGGNRGQADRSKIDAMNALIDGLGNTFSQGEAVGWKGLGPIGSGVVSPIYRATGFGSNPQEEALRDRMARVKAREAFGEGGKAFTGTEEKLVDAFIAATTDNPAVVKTRLNEAMLTARTTLRNLGVPDTVIDDRIRKALGGGAEMPIDQTLFGGGQQPPGRPGAGGGDVITDPNWGR